MIKEFSTICRYNSVGVRGFILFEQLNLITKTETPNTNADRASFLCKDGKGKRAIF